MGSIRTQKAFNIIDRKVFGLVPAGMNCIGASVVEGEEAGGLCTSDAYGSII